MSTAIGHMERVRAVAAYGNLWAWGGVRTGAQSAISLYDGVTNKALERIEVGAHVLSLCMTGSVVIAGCNDGAVRVFTLAGDVVHTLAAHQGECTAVALEPGGAHVFSAGTDGFVRRWALSGGAASGAWSLSTAPLRAVAIDPTGERFAAAGDDGAVRVVTLANDARREMSGHEGAVHALAFTPRDGRLASAGDDGTIRLWYLVGAVEFEARGADDSGHKGSVYALAFGPTGTDDGRETGEKLFSAGSDGAVKVWRLEDKKRTRALTLSSSPARALAVTAPTKSSRGTLLVGFDDRGLHAVNLEPNGAPAEYGIVRPSLLDALASEVWGPRPAREAAVRALAAMEEPEAHALLREFIEGNDMTPVRALAVAEAARFGRRELRPALVEALNSGEDELPRAAFDALRVLDGEDSLAPMRNALACDDPALRLVALEALGALGARVPLAVGMIGGRFDDADAGVRLAALGQWLALTQSPADALRVAFERAPADVRREVLVHAAQRGLLRDGAFGATVLRALDDADAEVRKTAFVALVVERKALLRVLEARDAALAVWVQELLRRAAQITHGESSRAPTDKEVKREREKIPSTDTGGAPTEDDRAPLLTAIACRSADTGLWGASGLAALGDPRALGALLQLSRELAPGVRAQTVGPLSGLEDPQASRRLVAMLDDQDAEVRAQARAAYAKVEGVRALAVAEASLRSSQEDIRVRGLDEVAKLPKSAAAEALLEDAIEDVSPRVRSEAFRTLWSWHDKTPEPALARALKARFADVRGRAVTELTTLSAKPWARERLLQAIGDGDEGVASAAFYALTRAKGEGDPAPVVAAMATAHATLRARGAQAALKCPAESVRAALVKLLDDEALAARTTAVESLDKLLPNDAESLYTALASRFVDLRLRASELLAERRDDKIIAPMQALMADKELSRTLPEGGYSALVVRAARALATLGSRALLGYFTDTLLTHANVAVREQGARGLAMASRAGDEDALVAVLANPLEAARSWAADGLSRLGDVRALPVLTGNLKNANPAIRLGAILSFAALGSAGGAGLLQGLDDAAPEGQVAALSVVLARDLRARRHGEPPELLLTTLSALPSEARFGAARALELRADPERYVAYLVNALTPTTNDRGANPKGFPLEPARTQILVGLAEALAGDSSAQRYAAAQVLLLRREPERYFRAAQRVAAPDADWIADTDLRAAAAPGETPTRDWLKKLFAHDGRSSASLTDADRALRELAFGAYVGLVRQVSSDEDGHRVRRSAIDRLVELGLSSDIGRAPVVAALGRALDDPQYLVRKAAFAGLRKVLGEGADEALELALASTAADVARSALDELGARGAGSLARVAKALNHVTAEVRWHAFQWVEKLSAPGSQEPMLMALASDYGDLRIGVIERLSSSKDPRVTDALVRAMGSEREDLRLRAAELLAKRRDDRAVDALAGFLRAENEAERARALAALSAIGSPRVVQVLGRHLSEATEARDKVIAALGGVRDASALDVLAARFHDETLWQEAFVAALSVLGEREKRNDAWALKVLRAAVKAKESTLRAQAAAELGYVRDDDANALLTGLFGDRVAEVRQAAVAAYGRRVTERNAPAEPIERVLREGARDLVLPAAEAVASRGGTLALQTLLLVARAGEPDEQPRAILALGTLADPRGLNDLELFAAGGTEEIPVAPPNRDAAFEALGRIAPKLTDAEARQRVIEKVEQASTGDPSGGAKASAVLGLRWIGGERARLQLEGIARNGDEDARAEACTALGALGDAQAEGAIAQVLRDPRFYSVHAPYEALRKLFPNERTRVELHALKASDEEMAARAARFLSLEGTPGALVSSMTDLDPTLRKRLLYGLLRRGAAPVTELIALLSHADASVRADAAWLIGARSAVTESDASLPWSTQDRATLANALYEAETAQSARWAALPAAERETESVAWTQTVWALGQVSGASHQARFEALATSSALEVPQGVRAEARRAVYAHEPLAAREKTLMELVAARDTAALITRVKSSTDDTAKREAVDALGRVGGEGATALLAALAFDKKSVELSLRKAAFRALRRVQRATQKTRREQRAEA